MPAVTLGQLQAALASSSHNSTFFMEPGGNFSAYVNEVGPRIYAMGPWRDLLFEQTYKGSDGYVSLDRDVEAIYACAVNDMPRRVNPLFHDIRTLGNITSLPAQWGLIDMGYQATCRDFTSIQGVTAVADVVVVTSLALVNPDGTEVHSDTLSGTNLAATVSVVGRTAAGLRVAGVLETGSTHATVSFSPGVAWIESITSTNLPCDIEIRTDAADSETTIAKMLQGTDVVRYRRFRVSDFREDTYVHTLVKRGWTDKNNDSDIIHLGNISAWKHALLGKVAEDTGDVETRAPFHWDLCRKLLTDELSAHQGAARPILSFDPYGGACGSLQNQY